MPPTETPHIPEPVKSERTPVGPTVGIVIIMILLVIGAFYFWGEHLNQAAANPPSYIPGDATTSTQ